MALLTTPVNTHEAGVPPEPASPDPCQNSLPLEVPNPTLSVTSPISTKNRRTSAFITITTHQLKTGVSKNDATCLNSLIIQSKRTLTRSTLSEMTLSMSHEKSDNRSAVTPPQLPPRH